MTKEMSRADELNRGHLATIIKPEVRARREKDIAECPCGGQDTNCTHCSECGGMGCFYCMDGTLLMQEDFE
jgi:hypothetical protein